MAKRDWRQIGRGREKKYVFQHDTTGVQLEFVSGQWRVYDDRVTVTGSIYSDESRARAREWAEANCEGMK